MADPLSDVLRLVRLAGGVFLEASFTAPWCVVTQIGLEECRQFLPDVVQVIGYHVVLEGSMLVAVEGEPPMEIRAGEIFLLPRNSIHTMASGPGLTPVSAAGLIQRSADGGTLKIRYGGGRAPTSIICGFLGTQDAFNPLLSALPKMLKLNIGEAASRDWVAASVRFAADELVRGRLASSSVMSRLSEVLLVEAVREYASTLGDQERGWLKGLSDPNIGRALALIHGDLAAPWSADTLASTAALSRSAFMERFTDLIGIPPIRYLTVWRLETAKRGLLDSRKSVVQIAHAVGYESEEGFRRAFKREFEMSPAEWRVRQANG
ncbi:AraC family transcriptional regulator [Rhodoblastus sp.]|jgi:AraC-like DNA-binding protein|uniref:AraC family transcriptional regulator n=1 Tax=Rhodoblastus sp. TaxID=1962975 RepID=UPI0025D99679|nr:AraC family transcriptional regulator [Rhodoblastus sp.]